MHISFVPVNYADQWLPVVAAIAHPPQLSLSATPVATEPSVSPRALGRQLSQTGPGAALAQVMAAGGATPRVLKSPSNANIAAPPPSVAHGGHNIGHVRQKSRPDDIPAQPSTLPAPLAPPSTAAVSLPPSLISPRAVAGTVPATAPISLPPPLPSFQPHDAPSETERLSSFVQDFEAQLMHTQQLLAELRHQIDQAMFAARQSSQDPTAVAYWRASLEEMHKRESALGDKQNELSTQILLARQQLRLAQLVV